MDTEQKADYLNNPNECPYCGSTDLEGDSFDSDDNTVSQEITCNRCYKDWTDVYHLVDVEG